MTSMRWRMGTAVLLCLACEMTWAAGPVSWREAVRAAVDWHPSIASAAAEWARAQSGVDGARSGYWPTVQLGMSTGREGDQKRAATAVLSASQMVYDFGKVRGNVRQAEATSERQRLDLLRQVDDVVQQTALALVEARRYQALVGVTDAQLEALGRVQKITDLRAQAGASTRSDPLQARARVDAVRATRVQLQAQRQQWLAQLRHLTGLATLDAVADGPADLDLPLEAPAEVDTTRIPAIRLAQADRDVAESQLALARAQAYPTLSLDAALNSRLGSVAAGAARTNNSVFLKVNSTLYQGGALAAQVGAAIKALEAAQSRIDVARTTQVLTQQSVSERLLGLQQARPTLEQRQKSIEETRALYREQYLSLGTRNVLDLLNAEQEIAQASTDRINNDYDTWRSRIELAHALGRLRAAFGLDPVTVQGLELTP